MITWSHQVKFLLWTTQWLQCDQTLPHSAKGVACKTRCHPPPPTKCASLELAVFLLTCNACLSFIARCTLEIVHLSNALSGYVYQLQHLCSRFSSLLSLLPATGTCTCTQGAVRSHLKYLWTDYPASIHSSLCDRRAIKKRGNHLYVTCWRVCDHNQNIWSVKSVLDCLSSETLDHFIFRVKGQIAAAHC